MLENVHYLKRKENTAEGRKKKKKRREKKEEEEDLNFKRPDILHFFF